MRARQGNPDANVLNDVSLVAWLHCVLFGDGAGAVVLEAQDVAEDGPGILSSRLHADGQHKDMLYDIISILSQEVAEINKLSIQDHHYPYEVITEGIRRVVPKLERLDENREDVIQRTQTLTDFRDILSSVLGILEAQVKTL